VTVAFCNASTVALLTFGHFSPLFHFIFEHRGEIWSVLLIASNDECKRFAEQLKELEDWTVVSDRISAESICQHKLSIFWKPIENVCASRMTSTFLYC
jgi:hypothetical protein